jgi:superfamily II DNA or RNA helicase
MSISPETKMISDGSIVRGPYWNNAVKITRCRSVGTRLEVDTVDLATGKTDLNIYIDPEQITAVEERKANRELWYWAIESWRIAYYDSNEEQLAPIISNIKLEPFQLEAVYEYILRPGTIRYLIAHDPGAGKTIIAGMVIKELEASDGIKKILLLVPPGIIPKWQFEMYDKFNDSSYRKLTKAEWDVISVELANPWERWDKLVMSPYFAMRKTEYLPKDLYWDLVLIDEAHKFNNPDAEKYHNFISMIARRCRHLLLLTATPHDGIQEHFLTIIRYLIPNIAFDDTHRDALGSLMIRRRKEELFHANGDPVFLARHVGSFNLELRFDETFLYTELINTIEVVFAENPSLHLIKMVYQRRFSSSIAALECTLKKRLAYISGEEAREPQTETDSDSGADSEGEEEEADSTTPDEKKVIALSGSSESIELEKMKVKQLLAKVSDIHLSDSAKWKKLLELLDTREGFTLGPRGARESKAKLLIFTEFRDTLDMLVKELRSLGWAVTFIHGGIPVGDIKDIKDTKAIPPFSNARPPSRLVSVEWFKNDATIMVATDAAGESIDLQFCHYLINWDIPWNPNRLEQRMGRIHRYGQEDEAYVFNFILPDTVEGKVQSTLMAKMEQIRDDFNKVEKGSGERVFNVISSIFTKGDITKAIQEMEKRSKDEQERFIAQFGEQIKSRIKNFFTKAEANVKSTKLRECLGLHLKDESAATEVERFRRARRETPEYLRDFFLAAWDVLGGKSARAESQKGEGKVDIYSIFHENPAFLGGAYHFPMDVSFARIDSPGLTVQVLQRGNDLFERVVHQFRKVYSDLLQNGEVLIDITSESVYSLYFFLVSFKNKLDEKILKKVILLKYDHKTREISEEFFTRCHSRLVVSSDAVFQATYPFWPDCVPDIEQWLANIGLDRIITPALNELKSINNPYITRLKESIDEYYRDFNVRSRTMSRELRDAEREKMRVKEIEMKEQIKAYQDKLVVIPEKPELISRALVLPGYRDKNGDVVPVDNFKEVLERGAHLQYAVDCPLNQGEIDTRGMDAVVAYEKRAGRDPRRVNKMNGLGYDVESYKDGKMARTIEVKSHYASGGITLEHYEKVHAEREPESSWIYVVENCAAETVEGRKILPIFNIARKHRFEGYNYTVIRYPISETVWKGMIEKDTL